MEPEPRTVKFENRLLGKCSGVVVSEGNSIHSVKVRITNGKFKYVGKSFWIHESEIVL